MAGSVPGFSLTPQFDLAGKIAPGAKLYVIQAGTVSTPQNPYKDTNLTILATNPLIADSTGRIEQFFLADGLIKLRLETKLGVQIYVGDNLLVVGASSGGGGGDSVDPTTIAATGDLKSAYGTSSISGWVRGNGRTIGSATSGASERANSDCQALYLYLWAADANLAVSGGRGVSAAADWAANKTLALPDFRGRVLAGLDDMGNTAAGRLTATYFGSAATTLGVANGLESNNVILTHTHAITDPGHTHNVTANAGSGGTTYSSGSQFANSTLTTASKTTGITINNAGSASAHNIVQPTILVTIYCKL